jgi:hypothetical protein
LNDERIVKAIESQLAAKGLKKVEPGINPDLEVAYHAAVGEETQLNTMDTGGWGYEPGWGYGWDGGGMSTTTVHKILNRRGLPLSGPTPDRMQKPRLEQFYVTTRHS